MQLDVSVLPYLRRVTHLLSSVVDKDHRFLWQ